MTLTGTQNGSIPTNLCNNLRRSNLTDLILSSNRVRTRNPWRLGARAAFSASCAGSGACERTGRPCSARRELLCASHGVACCARNAETRAKRRRCAVAPRLSCAVHREL